MHDIAQLMAQRIASGLKRKTLVSCSKWASQYRRMSKPFEGPWGYKYHPWLKEMHDTTAEINVGQKAAQMGFTEWAINSTFYKIDMAGVDCLYVLPTDGDASDFSAGRFDPALELSGHLRNMFSDVRNVGHKRAGQNNLYIRGSRSRSKLKSIPTGFIVFDEVEEMTQENIPLAMERASGQTSYQVLLISTPVIEDAGINKFFKQSTQEHFFFKCLGCGKLTELLFPECLVITAEEVNDPRIKDSYLKCKECHKKIEHELKHEWFATGRFVPSHTDRDSRGFWVPQLYSSAQAGRPESLATAYLLGTKDPTYEQEFWNSKIGVPHVVAQAKITDDDVNRCLSDHSKVHTFTEQRIVTMGVDVGKYIHYEVDVWQLPQQKTPGIDIGEESICYLIQEGSVTSFEQLDELIRRYNVSFTVCDRQPEAREAYRFACRFWGRVLLCIYGKGMDGKQVQYGTEDERTITVNRTSWMDMGLGRFHNRTIKLPKDLSAEYRKHVKNPTRIYERDKDGNPVGRYVSTDADHLAHARTYSELALMNAVSLGSTQNIASVH